MLLVNAKFPAMLPLLPLFSASQFSRNVKCHAGTDHSAGNRILMPAISTLVQQRIANIVKLHARPRIEAPELLEKDNVQTTSWSSPMQLSHGKGWWTRKSDTQQSTMNNASPASPTTLNLTSLCKEYPRSLGSAFIRNRIIVSCRVEKSSATRADTAISPPQS